MNKKILDYKCDLGFNDGSTYCSKHEGIHRPKDKKLYAILYKYAGDADMVHTVTDGYLLTEDAEKIVMQACELDYVDEIEIIYVQELTDIDNYQVELSEIVGNGSIYGYR